MILLQFTTVYYTGRKIFESGGMNPVNVAEACLHNGCDLRPGKETKITIFKYGTLGRIFYFGNGVGNGLVNLK